MVETEGPVFEKATRSLSNIKIQKGCFCTQKCDFQSVEHVFHSKNQQIVKNVVFFTFSLDFEPDEG